jgi:biopolymer transport protein ExbB
MKELISGAGIFAWPLLFCSIVAIFIICERLFASRKRAVLPPDLVDAILEGKPFSGGRGSVLGRVLEFSEMHRHDEAAVKAFARLEINRMERGFVFLEIIISVAPLLGLLGTVTGLLQVFATLGTSGTAIPDPSQFTSGIALALTTTVMGLAIAIPSVVGSGYLQRRVETYAAEIDSLLERIHARVNQP